ncbi:RidA family protein [Paralimibaculum aggregatum]|uniref:RidA family protein n=1 Tax=Paralimibaculum aggregatum TaxID=3036245 RepID=A0ABQ6LQ45_9RHOB|nr:RidA family protein [Limibaculum sp. NKW23]GMG82716.1 RidA family protein [Limibaculum sp. NKW23]
MTGKIEAHLAERGIVLPEPTAPVANYVPYVEIGGLLHVSGQISLGADGPIRGQLSAADHVDGPAPEGSALALGIAAARRCGLSLIAQAKAATGDLDRIGRVVKLTGFVNSAADFTQQPQVINGASDLMVEVFGDRGRHARAAVGVSALPLGVMVEIEAIFALD